MAQIITIFDDIHAILASQRGQRLARESGFSEVACVAIGTAILEVTRNIVRHAGRGSVSICVIQGDSQVGIQITASDEGPGIPDIPMALEDGYTTRGGLGHGLPGMRRLMDQFEITSQVGIGTCITMTRWKS